MHIFRRVGVPLFAIAVLVGLSVFALVSLGEGSRSLLVQKEGVTLRKGDRTTITFSLPWK